MKTKITLLTAFMLIAFFPKAQTVTDYDGNVYDTVHIGSRIWLKQNLHVTHYNNGTPIPNVTDSLVWGLLTSGARCYYRNDSAANDSVYGTLYNWFVVNNPAKVCPVGYHVPTDGEWTQLENSLGGYMVAGGALKEAGFTHWLSPNVGATNASGFTALPGGARMPNTAFELLHENGLFWTSTAAGANAYGRYVWYMFEGVERDPYPKRIGVSIRCIRDTVGVGIGSIHKEEKLQVFPNPTTGLVTVKTGISIPGTLELLNSEGMLMARFTLMDDQTQIDLSAYCPGIYSAKIICGNSIFYRKIVKD